MKLSFVMPAYNKEPYIAEAVNSFLAQKYKDKELVIIDDHSTDGTREICEYLEDNHDNVHYYRTARPMGVANCRNIGRSFAKGEIICVLDADDISYPHRADYIAKFFRLYPKLDIMYGSANIIDVTGKVVGQRRAEDFALCRIKSENYIVHSTVAYRNSIRVNYREDLKYIDDWYFYVDCYVQGYQFGHVNEILSAWRINPDGLTYKGGMKNPQKEKLKSKLIDEFKTYDEDLTGAMKTPQQRERINEILKEIPDGSHVLDVGCNGGYLMERARHKDCKVLGVEIAPNLRKLCELKGLETVKSLQSVKGEYDRIVFGDILEHYHKPEVSKLLKFAINRLRKDGKIIITVPHKSNIYSTQFNADHVADYEPKDFEDVLNKKVESRGIFVAKHAIPMWYLVKVSK